MDIPANLRWKSDGQELGKGGQGAVITVVDGTGTLPGLYALKALAPDKPAKAYERFAREVEAMKAVDHPNIAKIFGHSEPGDSFQFYVMEYIEGARPLKELLRTDENPFHGDALRSIRFFQQLVSAIAAWEKVKIVHRDLSPANVLILPSGDIKVIDFGICRIEDSDTITLTDESVGTHNYMAPECESGASGTALICSDLYSAGKLLWSAITNQKAISREDLAFTTKSMQAMFPDSPSTWHLHHIFAATIRRTICDRTPNAESALALAKRVEFIVASHYPPLELITERCPLCGWGTFKQFQGDHMVFGNPNPSGIHAVMCSYCGFCFARSWEQAKKNLDGGKSLS